MCEQEALTAAFEAMVEWNVEALLPKIRARTLVIHNRDNGFLPLRVGQRLAARIPDANFSVIDDPGHHSVPSLIAEFLGEQIQNAEPDLPSGISAILFADIANSTALTEELVDGAFREKARALDTALRDAISAAGGTAIEGKLLGDGVLATFNAAREAISCARACHAAGGDVGLALHVGIHAGDVIREEGNVFGGAVNVAARISDASEAGETLVSSTVRDLARTSAGVSFEDRGERDLKGVSDAVRVFAVAHPSAP